MLFLGSVKVLQIEDGKAQKSVLVAIIYLHDRLKLRNNDNSPPQLIL